MHISTSNNAYYSDTYVASKGEIRYNKKRLNKIIGQVCITIIDTIVLHIYTNNAYYSRDSIRSSDRCRMSYVVCIMHVSQ
jgi:hypothetical protein